MQCCIKTLYGYDLCTNLPRAVLTPTRYPAGQKSYSTEAGLLTCSDLCAFPISQWLIAQTCISQRERNLQQQVLFRILTGFPFHFGCSNSLKNHLHCKGSNYFVMLFNEGRFFTTPMRSFLECKSNFPAQSTLYSTFDSPYTIAFV